MAFYVALRWTASVLTCGPPFEPGARKPLAAPKTWWCNCGGVWWSWGLRKLGKGGQTRCFQQLPFGSWDGFICFMIGLLIFVWVWIILNGWSGDRGYQIYQFFLDLLWFVVLVPCPRICWICWAGDFCIFPSVHPPEMGTSDHVFKPSSRNGHEGIYWDWE